MIFYLLFPIFVDIFYLRSLTEWGKKFFCTLFWGWELTGEMEGSWCILRSSNQVSLEYNIPDDRKCTLGSKKNSRERSEWGEGWRDVLLCKVSSKPSQLWKKWGVFILENQNLTQCLVCGQYSIDTYLMNVGYLQY